MGTTKSIQFVHHHFPPNQHHWRHLSQSQQVFNRLASGRRMSVVIDEYLNAMGQMHTLKDYQSLQNQLETIFFRKQNSQCIVAVHDVILQPTHNLSNIIPDCVTGENKSFTIITQYIPYRLSDIGMLRFSQMIYILEQCFKGLHMLWGQFGKSFYIDEDQICFNSQGQCKIWINESLQKNHQNIDSSFLPKSIIQQLFHMLETRLEQTPPQNYHKHKSKAIFDKFAQAIHFIQKVKRLQNINMECLKSLKKQPSQSDSLKAKNKKSLRSKLKSQQKKTTKFSLKKSQNTFLMRKHNMALMTVASKEQPTEVSLKQIERRNAAGIEVNEFLRETYKSDRISSLKRQNPSPQYTEYSQKLNLWHSLYKRFPSIEKY